MLYYLNQTKAMREGKASSHHDRILALMYRLDLLPWQRKPHFSSNEEVLIVYLQDTGVALQPQTFKVKSPEVCDMYFREDGFGTCKPLT